LITARGNRPTAAVLHEKMYTTRITDLKERATENGVRHAGSRRHCGSHSSVALSIPHFTSC